MKEVASQPLGESERRIGFAALTSTIFFLAASGVQLRGIPQHSMGECLMGCEIFST
jgi:hypothetical protein